MDNKKHIKDTQLQLSNPKTQKESHTAKYSAEYSELYTEETEQPLKIKID